MVVLAGAYSYSLITGSPVYFWGKEFGVKHSAEQKGQQRVSETWTIRGETFIGDWEGQWQVTTDTAGFPCDIRDNIREQKGTCSAIFAGDRVFIRKFDPIGRECFYFGTKKDNTIEGYSVCGLGANPWTAMIKK